MEKDPAGEALVPNKKNAQSSADRAGGWVPGRQADRRGRAGQPADIRSRRRADYLDALLSAAPDYDYLLDPSGKLIYASAPGAGALGLSQEAPVGRTWQELGLPQEVVLAFDAWRAEVLSTGRSTTGDVCFPTPFGMRDYECVLSPVSDASGDVYAIAAHLRDITQRKQAEEERDRLGDELRAERDRLRALLDSMADEVWACDAEGNVSVLNALTLPGIGLDPAEHEHEPLTVLTPKLEILRPDGSQRPTEEAPLLRSLKGELLQGEEFFRHLQTGELHQRQYTSAPVRDNGGRIIGAVAVVRDVTAERQAQAERERLIKDLSDKEARLQAEQKLAAEREQFISVAAHELKTPIAIMKGYAQVLLRITEGASDRQSKMLEAIDHGATRIDRIVGELLDIDRLRGGHLDLHLERSDMRELAAEAIDGSMLAATGHSIRLAEGEPVTAYADRVRIGQVITELLDNAVKYSPAGAAVDVAAGTRNGEAVVSVKDQGVGIAALRQGRIFDRFYSAHAKTPYDHGGMGVSLYIAREVVERHGGRMWFESAEGKGSTFYFSLPLG